MLQKSRPNKRYSLAARRLVLFISGKQQRSGCLLSGIPEKGRKPRVTPKLATFRGALAYLTRDEYDKPTARRRLERSL